jgi:DNA-binding CsgD family transcriptional regulator
MSQFESPEEFQRELFALINRLISVDGLRFNVYVPRINLNQEVGSDKKIDQMVKDYAKEYWEHDPMHPSRFEETATTVITNSLLMTDFAWQKTQIFKEFFKPHEFFHNADVFFRQKGRVIAVLTLVRKDRAEPFTSKEVELLEDLQPFIQFSLSKAYLPKRVHDRTSLAEKFDFTARELDVVELALTGASNKVLTAQLKISQPTLRTHLQNIYTKVDVHSSSELISKLLGLLK